MSHKRPPNEVLKPTKKDMTHIFTSEFVGMSELEFSHQDFEKVRDKLFTEVLKMLTKDDKRLLLSFFSGAPDWSAFLYPQAQGLPAINWKLHNIARMNSAKRNEQIKLLETVFD